MTTGVPIKVGDTVLVRGALKSHYEAKVLAIAEPDKGLLQAMAEGVNGVKTGLRFKVKQYRWLPATWVDADQVARATK